MKLITIALFCSIAANTTALETGLIEIRDGATNDGQARIFRTGDDLFFQDGSTTNPVSLSSLSNSLTDHGSLQNIVGDDHVQYLNSTRHNSTHNLAFNNGMIVGPDVDGNDSLLNHLIDGDIHMDRYENNQVFGNWTFFGSNSISAGPLNLFSPQFSDDVTVNFQGTDNLAIIGFDDSFDRFDFSKPVIAPDVTSTNFNASTMSVEQKLSGLSGGVPSGVIEDFDSIAGIESENLLSRVVAESITGEWNFLDEIDVTVSSLSSAFNDHALEIFFQSLISTTEPFDNRKRTALFGQNYITIDAQDSMANTNLYGIQGEGNITSVSNSNPEGFIAGVGGMASNVSNSFHAIGVLGSTSTTGSSQNRIGILGSNSNDILSNTSLIPDGIYGGVFLGNVLVSGDLEITDLNSQSISAQNFSLKGIVDSSAPVSANEVVDWSASGELITGLASNSLTRSFAGVARAAGAIGTTIDFAINGFAEVTCNQTINIGDRVTWNGTSLVAATGSDTRTIGTALESHNGVGTVTVMIQVLPDID